MEKEINEIIKKARKDKDVLAVALFGSSLKGKGRDIDICIFLRKKFGNYEMTRKRLEFLRELPDKFDVNIFQQLPVYIRIRVLKGKILFVKDEDVLYELAFSTIKEFDSYEKLYNMYLEGIENG